MLTGSVVSRCTETKAPGIGGLQGRKRDCPSSSDPENRLQMGFIPKSGRLLPTRTTMVPELSLTANRTVHSSKSYGQVAAFLSPAFWILSKLASCKIYFVASYVPVRNTLQRRSNIVSPKKNSENYGLSSESCGMPIIIASPPRDCLCAGACACN